MNSGRYILDGHKAVPCDNLMEWAMEFEKMDRTVARTDFPRCHVSTVFLSLDHNFTRNGPPLLFETMVFGGKFDGDCERYSTWEEAERGHKAMCEKVRRTDK